MTRKEQILELLELTGDEYLSGTAIAAGLGITRSAVWKLIHEMSESGIAIESCPHEGYRLQKNRIALTLSGLIHCLSDKGITLPVELYREIDSTNKLARQYGAERRGDCIIVAASQTDGRGRFGHNFYSPPNTGLYLSLLLHPQCSVENAMWMTTAAAVAVCRAIQSLLPCSTDNVQIKWVNDIYMDGKKVCGILTEAQMNMENQSLDYAVLGIGVNLLPPEEGFPGNIYKRAGTVFECDNLPINAGNRLTAAIVSEFMNLYHDGNFVKDEFLNEYRRRNFLNGRTVTVLHGDEVYEAKVIGIDDELRLLVKRNDDVTALCSGEVSLIV